MYIQVFTVHFIRVFCISKQVMHTVRIFAFAVEGKNIAKHLHPAAGHGCYALLVTLSCVSCLDQRPGFVVVTLCSLSCCSCCGSYPFVYLVSGSHANVGIWDLPYS